MNKSFTIFEFGMNDSCLSIVDDKSDSENVITDFEYRKIQNFESTLGINLFKTKGHRRLIAQQYVGIFHIGNITIEILPKIEGLTANSIRKNLIAMLAKTRKLDIKDADLARLNVENLNLLEVLIRIYCEKFFAEAKKGLIHSYEKRQENLNYVKGKVLPLLNIRKNFINKERTFSEYEEFETNNLLNKSFKSTLKFISNFSKDNQNRIKLRELIFALSDVDEIHVNAINWDGVNFDRRTKRYEMLFNLSRIFVQKKTTNISLGASLGFSLIFDMNELFEEYIGQESRSIYQNVQLQGPKKYLLTDTSNQKGVFITKPDIVITDNGTRTIVDTKWKLLDPTKNNSNIGQQDIYQMLSYAVNYSSENVILLYPFQSNLSNTGIYKSYIVNNLDRETNIHVASVAIDDLSTVKSQLKGIFNKFYLKQTTVT